MNKGIIIFLAIFVLSALDVFAETGCNRKDIGTEEVFAFSAYNRVIRVSTKEMRHEGCCSVTIITTGSVTEPIVINSGGQSNLPRHFEMPSIHFKCDSSGVTVFW